MLNWPTACVIASTVLGGALLYNAPSRAQFDGASSVATAGKGVIAWQTRGGEMRMCIAQSTGQSPKFGCSEWD